MTFAQTIDRIAVHFGGGNLATVKRREVTTTGTPPVVSGSTERAYQFRCATHGVKDEDIDGTVVQSGDQTAILSAVGPTIPGGLTDNDKLTINGITYEIAAVRPHQPGATVNGWRVVIRGPR